MKRVWIGMGIGVVLVAFSVFTLFFTIKASDRIDSELQNALTASKEGDWDTASQKTENAYHLWKEKRPLLNAFYPHDPLELIEIGLDNLKNITKYKDREVFDVKCNEIIKRVSCIRECDLPAFGNIL